MTHAEQAEKLVSDLPDLMTTPELMKFFRVSRTTVFKWLKEDGKFPGAFQINKEWRIPKYDVINLAESFYADK